MNISRLDFIRGLFGAAATAIVPSVLAVKEKRKYAVMSLCPQNVVFKPKVGEPVVIGPSYNGIATYVEVDEETITRLRSLSTYVRFVKCGHVAEYVIDGGRYKLTDWSVEKYREADVCEDTSEEIFEFNDNSKEMGFLNVG